MRKYSDFSGRASRPEFWWFLAFVVGTIIILVLVDMALFPIARREEPPMFSPLSELFALVTLLPTFAVVARRLHDSGNGSRTALIIFGLMTVLGYTFTIMDAFALYAYEDDPFLVFLAYFSLAGTLALVVFMLKRSDPKDNEWGPAPEWLTT
ncbi:MAG: DUF805 domain-containing protein [Pseudomonadota bacterium]